MARHEALVLPDLVQYVGAVLGIGAAHAGYKLLQEPRHVVKAVIGPDEVLVGEGVGIGMGRYSDAVGIIGHEGLGKHLPAAQAVGDRVHEAELPVCAPGRIAGYLSKEPGQEMEHGVYTHDLLLGLQDVDGLTDVAFVGVRGFLANIKMLGVVIGVLGGVGDDIGIIGFKAGFPCDDVGHM